MLWILWLLHGLVALRLAPALPGPVAPWLFAAFMLASAVLIPIGFRQQRGRHDRDEADRRVRLGMLALGAFALLLTGSLIRELVLLATLPWRDALPPLATPSALAVLAFALIGFVVGNLAARRTAPVREVEVPIDGLPAALHGFTIAQISDLHVGPAIKRHRVQAVVDRVNALQADAVAITGDLVDGRVAHLRDDVAPLAGLRARHGSYFVTGNHEYYSGADEWTDWLPTLGLRVLANEHVVLAHDGARLALAGVTDFGAHHFAPAQRSDPQAAIAGVPDDVMLRVLLAHQPRSAQAAAEAGFHVQLSGHTHGGQIWPFHLLVPLQQPVLAGLHRVRSMWLYVSRGTGHWGPPVRLGAPSEITRLRLVAAPDSAAR